VELNGSLSSEFWVVLFKHQSTVEKIELLEDKRFKMFGLIVSIESYTKNAVELSGIQ